MAFVKRFGGDQVRMLHKPQPAFFEHVLFQLQAEKVIHGVAGNGGDDEHEIENENVEYILAGEKAGREEHRIAGQKETD